MGLHSQQMKMIIFLILHRDGFLETLFPEKVGQMSVQESNSGD